MKVADQVFVAIDYRLSVGDGEEVDRSTEGQPLCFVTGAGRIIPGLEKALMGMEAGDESQVALEPEDAYGPVQDDLFQNIPRSKFPAEAEIELGQTFQAQGPRGPAMITIAAINDDETVTIDLNHPLAGKKLHFDVKVVEVREPKAEELQPMSGGCACGPGGAEESSCGSGSESGCACG